MEHTQSLSGPDGRVSPTVIRLYAVLAAARYHGLELDIRDFAAEPGEDSPSPATLARWLNEQGAVAKGMRLRWRYLVKIRNSPPVVLMFKDGSAGLMVRADAEKGVVWLRDPMGGEVMPRSPSTNCASCRSGPAMCCWSNAGVTNPRPMPDSICSGSRRWCFAKGR